jgi:mannose-6-phosphate isomerase
VIHHPWGEVAQVGRIPYIADLLGVPAPADLPFGELWLGVHEAAPSLVTVAGEQLELGDLAARQPAAVLGTKVAETFSGLPFLLKVLSCDRPLSIQAHPDKGLAAQLHARDPEHYPDANHKPEIAIALTPFEAMCSFRHAAEIRADLARHGLLDGLFAGLADDDGWLRAAYGRLFTAGEDVVRAAGEGLATRLANVAELTPEDRCFLKLWNFYPGDRGTFSAFFLNHFELQPGESVFLSANEPHAYINGVIVECMANSNNVVRAGCTGKFIDRDVLLSMLAYREGPPPIEIGREIPGGRAYEPPTPEFAVDILELQAGQSVRLTSLDLVSVLLVLEGTIRLEAPEQSPQMAQRGSAWLWPASLPNATLVCESETGRIVRARPNL